MRSKRFGTFLFVIAIGLAAMASYFAVHEVNSYKKTAGVIKVVKDIPPYTMITEKDVVTADVPLAAISASTEKDAKKVIGKYSKTFIPKDGIVDENDLAKIDGANGAVTVPLSEMNKSDIRAIGIAEDYIHVLGDNVKEQDHVDLMGMFTKEKESFAKTIAQGVPVLHRNPMDKGGGMIVAVSAKQAEEISLAMAFGKLVVSVTPYKYENKPMSGTYLESLFINGKDGGK